MSTSSLSSTRRESFFQFSIDIKLIQEIFDTHVPLFSNQLSSEKGASPDQSCTGKMHSRHGTNRLESHEPASQLRYIITFDIKSRVFKVNCKTKPWGISEVKIIVETVGIYTQTYRFGISKNFLNKIATFKFCIPNLLNKSSDSFPHQISVSSSFSAKQRRWGWPLN